MAAVQIRVYCRVKPVLLPDGQPGALRMLADKRSLAASVNGQDHSFTFNQVFGPSATQVHAWRGQRGSTHDGTGFPIMGQQRQDSEL